jgi:hypothetical protein
MMTAAITITGLEDWMASVDGRLARIEEELRKPSGPGYYDIAAAAVYLSTTAQAVRAAVRRGHIEASRSTSGRIMITKLVAPSRSGASSTPTFK